MDNSKQPDYSFISEYNPRPQIEKKGSKKLLILLIFVVVAIITTAVAVVSSNRTSTSTVTTLAVSVSGSEHSITVPKGFRIEPETAEGVVEIESVSDDQPTIFVFIDKDALPENIRDIDEYSKAIEASFSAQGGKSIKRTVETHQDIKMSHIEVKFGDKLSVLISKILDDGRVATVKQDIGEGMDTASASETLVKIAELIK